MTGVRLMFENSTVCLIVDGISLCDLSASLALVGFVDGFFDD